ncbi:heterocyst frequency control protein PatD [Merismopedia glauca]|uniref:Heterocyst frequency control protein PatD n=1 Tax=Merismopedia glauca CCAP 1448/3 TaxID=1296344 RepID=A0A2T1C8W3_9CYAN|nr:heterocyst frequency control protein PatD [Merismopedia glauca]PSB04715.1 hypothetical protein C7B64_02525 [Merismopedia glauca CCAP 1448/3]
MLSPTHWQKLQSFSLSLDRMLQVSDRDELQASFAELESEFRDRIMPLSCEGLDSAVSSLWVSYLTEMHKQMRLLQTELIYLRSVRQPEKVQERFSNVRQCLEKLRGYCETFLEKL